MIEVTVIIINYNTKALTIRAIEAVRKFTKDVSYEIVLVDNASLECSPNVFLEQYPEINLVTLDKNLGFAKGNNEGIKVARGNKILLLNSDAFLLNDAISICARSLDENPDRAVVTCRLENEDKTPQYSCQRFPGIRVLLFELFRLQKLFSSRFSEKVLLGSFFKYDREIYVDWTWGAFFMFNKDLLKLFPSNKLQDDFFMYGEDLYWCKYISQRGKKVYFDSKARVLHLMGGSSGPKSEMMEKNHETFMHDFYSGWKRKTIEVLEKLLLKSIKQ